jgi:two-component system, chemotaxis family, CheB/CheR fusion protein
MIGLGGSAGSIPALKTFVGPADSGMVFVVIIHLSPEHELRQAKGPDSATGGPGGGA